MIRAKHSPVLVVLVLFAALSAQAQPSSDEARIADRARQFFAAYAAHDLDSLLALWDHESPSYTSGSELLRMALAANNVLVRDVGAPETKVNGETALSHMLVDIEATDKETGLPQESVARGAIFLDWKKSDGDWKVERYGNIEEIFAGQLIQAKTLEARHSLLDAQPSFRVSVLVRALSSSGSRAANQGKVGEGLRICGIAEAIAKERKDFHALSGALVRKGNIYRDQANYHAALQAYQDALNDAKETLFQHKKSLNAEVDSNTRRA
jgi:ketosteroid isomerase-like protein